METKDNDESIITHLEALRATLIRCISALGIMIIPMLFIAPKCLDCFIKFIIRDNNIVLNYFSPVEVFIIQIKVALILALVVTFPYIAKQLWSFLVPALYEHERKFISSIVVTSSVLFVCGALFCCFIILPFIIRFAMSFSTSNINPVLGISTVVNLSLWLILSFGVMFQLPLVTYSLIKSDILSYETISSKRPYVIVVILIIASLLTPPDIISQIMLFIPTYLLFELGLFFSPKTKKSEDEFEELEETKQQTIDSNKYDTSLNASASDNDDTNN